MRSLVDRLVRCLAPVMPMMLAVGANAQGWEVFNMDNAGLPSNSVRAMVQDETGVIWVATDWGLCRFDGTDWTTYQQGTSGISDNVLSCLAVDADQRLWIGTINAGIAILDPSDDSWSYIDMTNSILVDNEIAGITHDHRGWVWISTPSGLYCWTGTDWRWYNDTDTSYDGNVLFGPNMSAVVVRDDDLVTVATRNAGLTYITEDDFLFYTSFQDNFPDNSANGVALDALGDRWLACPAGGLIRHAGPYEGGPWFQYNNFTIGLPDNTLTSILIDELDRKIAGSETAGILVFSEPSSWYTMNAANSGLPDNWVRCVMIDEDGALWAGMNYGGVARLDGFVGISERGVKDHDDIRVFPNPCSSSFQADLSSFNGNLDWSLMDASGRTVLQGVTGGGKLLLFAVESLSPGPYLFRVGNGSEAAIQRLVIH